ncbi:ultraviolet-B receptor UVR8 isoform X1 [Selaginella moellendorffii]|uniref:ultraviolet-B receptor UVR8 isoform X1 n=1 Tax=Selaginella moellendorffii TaxID=88036 RepID=UPI000D1CB05B|nr:ultraviolet-B receptor UVR8 isoform X1 [Selaginella moellendorffii]|eukprot:XP_024526793.1 ultraviolet-B receptor UVR8 isoform X1 [Selaginella moellendorffii]
MPSPVKKVSAGLMEIQGTRKLGVRMWGYLPASSPQRSPIVVPTKVSPASPDDGWRAVCSGGCGFALALSESGKLHTWGSTDDLGQCYHISGKHQEHPEPFPLQTPPAIFAAAGWAHCAVVTETGEVYTWGWKECVPSDKNCVEQGVSGDPYDYQGRTEELKHVEPDLDSSPGHSPEALRRLKRAGPDHNSPEKHRLGSSSSRVQSPRSALKVNDKVDSSKKRKVSTDEAGSPDSSGAGVDEAVVAPLCCVPMPAKVILVATGGRHTLSLTDTGQVWSWGYGGEGQLGLGTRMRTVSSPQPIPLEPSTYWLRKGNRAGAVKPPGSYIVGIACGGRHSAILTDGGAVLTFGWGLYGQCGQGSTEDELSPNYVSSLGGLHVTAIASGLWHTLCITDTGEVYAFGGNQFGQLGVGGDHSETLPKLVEAAVLEDECAKSVSCGARHSAITTEKGKVFCWGWNKYGQLGLGDTGDRDTPHEVPLEHRAVNVACGWWHTLALTDQP